MSTPRPADLEVRDDPDNQRYVAVVDGEVAGYADYHEDDGATVFPRTVVEEAFGGRGIGKALVRGALDDMRTQGRRVVPVCPFFASYIDKHVEYQDLVDEALTERLRDTA